jgi:hypothetical protein
LQNIGYQGIVTGNGFTGNAQRIQDWAYDSGGYYTASGNFQLAALDSFISGGTTYYLSFKHRNSNPLYLVWSVYNNDYIVGIIIPPNIGNAIQKTYNFYLNTNPGGGYGSSKYFGFVIDSSTTSGSTMTKQMKIAPSSMLQSYNSTVATNLNICSGQTFNFTQSGVDSTSSTSIRIPTTYPTAGITGYTSTGLFWESGLTIDVTYYATGDYRGFHSYLTSYNSGTGLFTVTATSTISAPWNGVSNNNWLLEINNGGMGISPLITPPYFVGAVKNYNISTGSLDFQFVQSGGTITNGDSYSNWNFGYSFGAWFEVDDVNLSSNTNGVIFNTSTTRTEYTVAGGNLVYFTYGNLIFNGGGLTTSDWINPDVNGFADGWGNFNPEP